MKIITGAWKGRDSKYYNPRMGFGICRLLEEVKHAGNFIPTKDMLKLYSITNDLRLGEFTDELVATVKPELITFYERVKLARLMRLKKILIDCAKSGILINTQIKNDFKLLMKVGVSTAEGIEISKDVLFQASTVPHVADKYGEPNAAILEPGEVEALITPMSSIDLIMTMVKLCMLPPEWRSLHRLPNDTILENSPHEYVQQNLIPRFAEKSFDTHTPGVSRACSQDPFTLLLTTKETMGVDYGTPRSNKDSHYRILCDIYNEEKK